MDSQSAIRVGKNQGLTKRRNYTNLRHPYLQLHTRQRRLQLHHFSSKDMLADTMTKPLRVRLFRELLERLQIVLGPIKS